MARTNGKTDTADLTEQMATIKSDLAILTSLVSDLAEQKSGDAIRGAKMCAESEAEQVKAKAAEMGAGAHESAQQAIHYAKETMRKQPGLAIGVAAASGFIIGLLLARRG